MCFSKKKLVSGFGLALVSVSNFVFVLFFNYNFTNPISNEHFFHGIGINNNGSHIAWSFSFNTTSSPNYTYSFSAAILLKNVTQVDQNLHRVDDILDTHLGNFSNDVKNGSFNGVPKKVLDFKDTQLMKLRDDAKNRSFIRFPKKVVDFEDTHLMKLRDDAKNRSSIRFPMKVVDFEATHLMKLKKDVKNGSFGTIVVNPKKGEVVINQENGNGIFVGFRNVDSKNKKGDNGDGDHAKVLRSYVSSFKECDIFDGKWVRDNTKPYYPAGSCRYVERAFNCYRNNRPDRKFVKWRWQPFGCQIPSLNATDFLERLRGKKLVFVGDSINRNMCESLICILRNSLTDRGRAYEISKGIEFQKQGHRAFKFVDYNFTMDYVKSPFLVRQSSYKGKHGLLGTLRLDLMDSTTSMYKDADILIFNTGHWWTPEKTSKGNNFYQEGHNVHPRLEVLDAYTRALSTWATWVDNNIDSQKTQVFYRGDSVNHFGGGRWNSGGQCHSETEPIFNTSRLKKYPPRMRILDHYLRVMKTPVTYLNISRLTDYRKDGHPSIYRRLRRPIRLRFDAKPPQDCSHWCLPGVPDTWNELLYASLMKVGRGSWKS